MGKIYIFSGLGVDKRVFDNIDFRDLDIEFVDWIDPLKSESMENYAKRISRIITSEKPILSGYLLVEWLRLRFRKFLKQKK